MSSKETSTWQAFFTGAGIPSTIAGKYAKLFAEQRIQRSMLPDLDKTTLKEIGVTAIGDQIAILRCIRDHADRLEEDDEVSAASPQKADSTRSSSSTSHKKTNAMASETSTSSKAPPAIQTYDESALKPAVKAPKVSIKMPLDSPSNGSATSTKRGELAPDRHDTYLIKMPLGKTAKSRELLQKAAELKQEGLLARATSGARKSGQTVESKNTVFGRLGLVAGPETDTLTNLEKRMQRKRAADTAAAEMAVTSTTGTATANSACKLEENSVVYPKLSRMASDSSESSREKKSAVSGLQQRLGKRTTNNTKEIKSSTLRANTTIKDSPSQFDGGALFRRTVASLATVTVSTSNSAKSREEQGNGDLRSKINNNSSTTTTLSGRLGKKPAIAMMDSDETGSSVFKRLG